MQTGNHHRGAANPSLEGLATLVVKQGVAIGGLTQPQRELALAVPALALAPGVVSTEAGVNELLERLLAAEAGFLRTDHVELRRWLIDSGWWRRDGFGRAYERTTSAALRSPLAAIEGSLRGVDLPRWVAQQREAARGAREAKLTEWAARAGAPVAAGRG
jgi:hypothetical protein